MAGIAGELRRRRRRDVDLDLARLVAMLLCDRLRRVDGVLAGDLVRRDLAAGCGLHHEASTGERRRVGGVLLLAALEEVLADVEHERCDGHDPDEPEREDREDLAGIATCPATPPLSG